VSDLDALRLASSVGAVGPDRAGDPSLVSTGTVVAVDAGARLVTVAIRGDTQAVVQLPAVADRYRSGGSCRVLHNPQDRGRSVHVFGAVDPLPPLVLGTLTAINTSTYRATVAVLGSTVTIPYAPTGTYTTDTRVWVQLDGWGSPLLVVAPSSEAAATDTPTPPAVDPGGNTTVQVAVAVGPQGSGTFRVSRGEWDRWNTGRYGGASTLYQGSDHGSGPLIGLATYGDQIVNLGAISIDRVKVMLRGVGLSGASGPATVQGAADGGRPAGAPTTLGEGVSGEGWVDLPPSVFELMRTGAVKGLATVGPNYYAVAGAGNGDGMVLEVTYTRPA
jgi:hypothetical protein